jgi:hypothetical protein
MSFVALLCGRECSIGISHLLNLENHVEGALPSPS